MLHPDTAMERLRQELVAEAWLYAKMAESHRRTMSPQQLADAIASMRKYRNMLDNFDTHPEAI